MFAVLYKGENVESFVPDLIAFDAIVVDTKVIDRITDHERGITALLSSHRILEWERVVL